jgi:hypothetical protein
MPGQESSQPTTLVDRSAGASFVPQLDRPLESLQIRIMDFSPAAQRFAITFVESVETCGIEDLPKWLAVAEDSDECSFAGRAVNLERQFHEILGCQRAASE